MSVNDGQFHEMPIDREIRTLIDTAFAPPDQVTWPWVALPLVLVAGGIGTFVYISRDDVSATVFGLGVALGLMLVIVPGLVLLAALAGIANDRRLRTEYRTRTLPRREALLSGGTVAAATFQAERALLFEPFEDEGFLYLFGLTDGSTLVLHGNLPPLRSDQAADWPGSHFRLLRSPDREDLLGVVGDGSTLDVSILPRALAVANPAERLPGAEPLPCEAAARVWHPLDELLPILLSHCSECGYSLRGSTTLSCPECGHAFLT